MKIFLLILLFFIIKFTSCFSCNDLILQSHNEENMIIDTILKFDDLKKDLR